MSLATRSPSTAGWCMATSGPASTRSVHRHPGLDPGSMTALPEWMPDQVRHDEEGGRVDSPNSKVYYPTNAPRRLSMRLAFLIPPMMLLAACGSEEKKASEGTEIPINEIGRAHV